MAAEQRGEPPAFVVFVKEVTHDQAELDRYASLVGASFEGHAPTIIAAYGAQEVLEGPPVEGVVIVRFPDVASAQAWYRSPQYQAAAEHRFKGATYRAILVAGRPIE